MVQTFFQVTYAVEPKKYVTVLLRKNIHFSAMKVRSTSGFQPSSFQLQLHFKQVEILVPDRI